ncbi:MAG TPA: hypothetical protein VL854_14460 [Nitrososphaeraceae archaeon]|jgi:hypothetical protein|nr:hypothetical protein [Nitrososphaeraceae archaeon]
MLGYNKQVYIAVFKTLLWSVIVLAFMALVFELLPEIEAKIFVIPVLLLIIAIGIIDLWRLKREEKIE